MFTQKTGGAGYVYDNEYGKGFSPDYGNSDIIEGHAKAFGRLASITVRRFLCVYRAWQLGHWASGM
jgi:hypothetical protein